MEKVAFLITEDGFRIDDGVPVSEETTVKWRDDFVKAPYETLYALAFADRPACFDPAGIYLCQLAEQFAEDLAASPGLELARELTVVECEEETVRVLLDSVPFVLGSEHVTEGWIREQYSRLCEVFRKEIAGYDGKVAKYLAEKNKKLLVPERIFFHLVDNAGALKSDEDVPEYPFAFLATYATQTEDKRIRHTPLQYALTEFSGERQKLLELLSCLEKAAEASKLIGKFMVSGELFHPLYLTADEAYQFLQDVPDLEAAGICCRIPNWWRRRNSSVAVTVKLGEDQPSMMGLNTLLHTVPSLTVNGVPLTEEEIQDLLARTEGLAFLKGRWVEVNHAKLQELLEMMKSEETDLTLVEALRAQLTGQLGDTKEQEADVGPIITNGKWLGGLMQTLRNPSAMEKTETPQSFCGQLRPYQYNGFNWLLAMNRLGFGACLADDMGLGKTVQILAFLEQMRQEKPEARVLLVVPASLLGNWQREAQRFVPGMPVEILHGASSKVLNERFQTTHAFLTITTYRMAVTIESLSRVVWDCLILDEAQAIKNPVAQQTRRLKTLQSRMRIAMTGTPIENNLTNLWSLFDFLDKGLLGSSQEFRGFCSGLEDRPEGYARLKNMIAPFLLRRVKTDRNIISDLPEKTEQVDYVEMSKKQVVLYRQLVRDMQKKVLESEGIERRGLVLSLILHLKQICNHPDQYLGQKEYSPSASGKFEMLRSLAETIYEKRERMLVFTQFKEITGYLDDFLAEVFHCRGGVIHGSVSVGERNTIVERFQSDAYVPYLVLSVKAGGTGLNLTKANHVVHFDRWWNPAVENQATDRAFRIGQQKNVFVHKFVCRGSIEEKIDALINSKKELAENVIGSGGEKWITELSNEELISLLTLD